MPAFKILCFGDSLTKGYSDWGMTFTPYADNMVAWLKKSWPDVELEVVVDGLSGDLVSEPGSFLSRLRAQCSSVENPFDWIVILGGTNDLAASARTPESIFAALESCYQVAFDHGAKVLAMTVPEAGAESRSLDERRARVNQMILGKEDERFETFDLFSSIPYHSLDQEDRENIWDDAVHMTPYGYGVMGDRVAQRLVELVKSEDLQDRKKSTRAKITHCRCC